MINKEEVIKLRENGKTYREIADIFCVTPSYIGLITTGYLTKNKEKIYESIRKYQVKNREKFRDYVRQSNLKIKTEALTHYGNGKLACVRCGFNDIRALSIDHINGNGSIHRKVIVTKNGGRVPVIYRWLKQNNYPEGFQTLCMNCQWIKRFENNENSNLRVDGNANKNI